MGFSKLVTRTITTPNSSPRAGGAVPRYIVHHHMATTGFEGVLGSWRTGRKQGSAHAAISNTGEVVGVVDERRRAWSLSSEFFDSQALVTEIANSAVGGGWLVSAAAHEAAAQLTADWCRRYNIPCTREYVIGHKEVFMQHGRGYATACPGGLSLNAIVARARAILGGSAAPAPSRPAAAAPARPVAVKPAKAAGKGWDFATPSKAVQLRIQRALKARGRYAGRLDGAWGVLSIKGIQLSLRGVGYTGDIDGIPGQWTCFYVQKYAERFGSYTGGVDKLLGPFSWAGFALGLERP